MSSNRDPLASSKVTAADATVSQPSKRAKLSVEIGEVPTASSSGMAESSSSPEPALPSPSASPKPVSLEVERKITVSWGGQFITLHPGTIISEASHGPGCIERMRSAGVAFREVAR